LRSSTNPQQQHTALLLLARIAELFPARVLDSIIPVFTFMGANTVRQDDNFNFVVLQRTITAIVPALLGATRLPVCFLFVCFFRLV
jgi:U3 small nucleolar RNA-associated protein 10